LDRDGFTLTSLDAEKGMVFECQVRFKDGAGRGCSMFRMVIWRARKGRADAESYNKGGREQNRCLNIIIIEGQ